METVIAKAKKGFMLGSYITILVIGALFFVFGGSAVIFGTEKSLRQIGVIIAVVGVFLTAAGLSWTIYLARLPKVYLSVKDGKLRFYNGLECSPSEVISCSARCDLMDGALYNCGKLMISVGNVLYKFKFVEGANNVAATINALKAQTMAVESMQQHIAERKLAEQGEAENENKEV